MIENPFPNFPNRCCLAKSGMFGSDRCCSRQPSLSERSSCHIASNYPFNCFESRRFLRSSVANYHFEGATWNFAWWCCLKLLTTSDEMKKWCCHCRPVVQSLRLITYAYACYHQASIVLQDQQVVTLRKCWGSIRNQAFWHKWHWQ